MDRTSEPGAIVARTQPRSGLVHPMHPGGSCAAARSLRSTNRTPVGSGAGAPSVADIQRHFNALFGTTVAYKPFQNQLAKRQFADFMRELVSALIERWTVRVLQASGDGAFSEFDRIVIQDGSSFAVHDALAERYPGRFRARCPAAVELHVTMDLLQDRATKVTLTADTAPERPHLPPAHTLQGERLLADRGYFERGICARSAGPVGTMWFGGGFPW